MTAHAEYLLERQRAYDAGMAAARAGRPESTCPHPGPDSSNAQRRSWLRGWHKANETSDGRERLTGLLRERADLLARLAEVNAALADAETPAGEGAASLFIRRRDGESDAVWFKAHDGRLAPVLALSAWRTVDRAMWEHLNVTLPTREIP